MPAGSPAGDVLLLDPAALKGDSSYVDVGVSLVSPDERLLAYSVDTTGDEVYTLRFRDLEPEGGGGRSTSPTRCRASYYGGAWSADSQHVLLHRARRRRTGPSRCGGTGSGRRSPTTCWCWRRTTSSTTSRSGRPGPATWSSSTSPNRDTTEVWLVDAHRPEEPPRLRRGAAREVEYRCEHARTPAGDRLLIVTNDGAPEFRLMSAPLDVARSDSWVELLAGGPGRAALRRRPRSPATSSRRCGATPP